MRFLLALFLGLWASVANADFYTGVLQQQAQQTPTGGDFPVVASATYGESETGTLVVTPDITVPDGQLIVIAFFSPRAYATVSVPNNTTDGFNNNVVGFGSGSNYPHASVWTKTASSEPASYTFTVPSSVRPWGWVIMRITGATGFDVAATASSSTNTDPIPVPSATTTQANTLILRGAVTYLTSSLTIADGLTEVANEYISTEGHVVLGWETQAAIDATGAVDFTPNLARTYASFTVGIY